MNEQLNVIKKGIYFSSSFTICGGERQPYRKCRSFSFHTLHSNRPAMPFGYNIVRQTQPQACALACGFGGEKGLKDFGFDGF